MITHIFSPPVLYCLVGFVVVISLVLYLKREPVKRELRRWRGKALKLGPLKLERKEQRQEADKTVPSAGVHFGKDSNFTNARVKGVAGRDIRRSGSASTSGGHTPGVAFGEKGRFSGAKIERIAGRDLEEED